MHFRSRFRMPFIAIYSWNTSARSLGTRMRSCRHLNGIYALQFPRVARRFKARFPINILIPCVKLLYPLPTAIFNFSGGEEPSKQYKKMVSNSTFYTQSTRTVIHYVIWSYMFTGAEEKTICRNVTQPISTEMASGINILTQNSSRNNKKEGESNVHLTWLYFGGFYTSV